MEGQLPHNCSLTISARLPATLSWDSARVIRRSEYCVL